MVSSYEDMMTLRCCQDHILTENICCVWSETSYSGDERRWCYRCGTNERTNDERTLKIELLSRWKLEAEFRKLASSMSETWLRSNTFSEWSLEWSFKCSFECSFEWSFECSLECLQEFSLVFSLVSLSCVTLLCHSLESISSVNL